MLSLFGYDPGGDYYRLMEEHPNRRINLSQPERSLLLEKAIGAVPHSGGELFSKDSESYAIIRDWIAAGAKRDAPDSPTITGIKVSPTLIEYTQTGTLKPIKVMATYSDGTERDVTRWCLFMSSNDAVVSIDDQGQVKANRPGVPTFSLASIDSLKEQKSSSCLRKPWYGNLQKPTITLMISFIAN